MILSESESEIRLEDLEYVIHWLFDDFPPDKWVDELQRALSPDVVEDILKLHREFDLLLTRLESEHPAAEVIGDQYRRSLIASAEWRALGDLAMRIRERFKLGNRASEEKYTPIEARNTDQVDFLDDSGSGISRHPIPEIRLEAILIIVSKELAIDACGAPCGIVK